MNGYVLTTQAQQDIDQIWFYIARDNPKAADGVIESFHYHFRSLARHPRLGRARENLAPSLRSFPIGSYVLFYRPTESAIEIVRVLHGAREIQRSLFQ